MREGFRMEWSIGLCVGCPRVGISPKSGAWYQVQGAATGKSNLYMVYLGTPVILGPRSSPP